MKLKAGLKTKHTFKLIKWDKEAPENWKQIEHPEQHPDCVEILEWELGKKIKTTYQRNT